MPETTVEQTLEEALRLHQAHQFSEAEALYRQVLARRPNHPGALHLLGVLAYQLNRPDVAVDLINQSIAISPNSPQAHGNLGLALAGLGRYAQAIQSYRRALELKPDFLDAHNNLGAALQEIGQLDQAILEYQQTIQINPNYAGAFINLGSALHAAGRLDDALAAFRHSIQIDPNIPEAHNNLGNVIKAKGDLSQAIACYRRAISLRPDFVHALNNLAVSLLENDQPDQALYCAQKAVAFLPNFPEAHNNLANVLRTQRKFDEAIAEYQRALELNPNYAEAHNNLGIAYQARGMIDQAVASLQRAAEFKPDSAEIQNNLGCALKDKPSYEAAMAAFEKAIALDPKLIGAIQNLALAYREQANPQRSIELYKQALDIKPDDPNSLCDLAISEKDAGNLDLALSLFRRAIDLDPKNSLIHSNLLYSMHFSDRYDAPAILKEHLAWAARHAAPLQNEIHPPNIDPPINRRLRIGYVSPDLRGHVIGRHLLPLLANHDRSQFEIFCYTDVRHIDAFTREISQHVEYWRNTLGQSDAELADTIRADKIDILVDLTLHASGTRLLAFARKPAPIQITYLAYCSTSGLATMDYRISDPYMDPDGADVHYTEKTLRLPKTYWCYQSGGETPDISPLPAQPAGHVTFGCLNNFAKVSTGAFDTWLQLLLKVPRSRLILHTGEGEHRNKFIDHAAKAGITADRIEFFTGGYWPQYIALYNRIDIALDPFPYGGGITTCDGLWMGVPLITLIGQTAVGRGGASILSNLNLKELIAKTPQEYLQIAADLANDLPRLAALRSSLRDRMQNSSLRDAPAFARDVEFLYRQLIEKHVAAQMQATGRPSAAIASYERALKLNPNDLVALNDLGNAHQEKGNLDQAVDCYQKVLALNPNSPATLNNFANTEKDRDHIDQALILYQKALLIDPANPKIHSNFLYSMHLHPESTAQKILKAHKKWAGHYADPLGKDAPPPQLDPVKNRRLRIGYISPEFRSHVVGRHMLPLLANHDKSKFEIFCYSDVRNPDHFTQQLRQHTDHWHITLGQSDADLAEKVRTDKIDILVDLTLHTFGSRLLAFARKPAPIQLTWLGYCSTTGLAAMDYRLSDPYMDPPGDESDYVEKTILLPKTFWCYQTGGPTPDVSPLPAAKAGYVTFACLNNFAKVSVPTQNLWARLLAKVPNSRVIIQTGQGSHRDEVLQRFAKLGVSADRIQFFSRSLWKNYIEMHSHIDIALDPFPYGGGITTCDALYMGVPVITLTGKTAVGRGGTSILSNLNLHELIAKTPNKYLQIAAALAGDLSDLSSLRQSLRSRMQNSPLMDATAFARDFEAIYQNLATSYQPQ